MVENCATIAEMRESKGLAKHVLMVMNTLDDTIHNLNDMQYVIDLLYDIGKQHRTFSDFRREFFLVSSRQLFSHAYIFSQQCDTMHLLFLKHVITEFCMHDNFSLRIIFLSS